MSRYEIFRFSLAALFSLSLVVADIKLQAFDSLRSHLSLFLTPFRYIGRLPTNIYEGAIFYVTSRQQLVEEKQQLEAQLLQQTIRMSSLDFFVAQNDELRSLLALRDRVDGAWIAADIRQETSLLQQNRIYLNKGVENGVLPGMGVVDENGVVGQVIRADSDNSALNLLAHPRQWIAVRVRRTGYFAIVRGTGGGMEIYSIPSNADLQEGDELIADGGVFPSGYPVGVVSSITRGVRYLQASVTPASSFYGHRSLLVYVTQLPASETL